MAGSLTELMDEVVALEETVNAALPRGLPPLRIDRWRPDMTDTPLVYHRLRPGPVDHGDPCKVTDWIELVVRVVVDHVDSHQDGDELERYTDALRGVLDAAWRPPEHRRISTPATFTERFNEISIVGMEMTLRMQLVSFFDA